MDAFVLQRKPVGRLWGAGLSRADGLPVGEWWLCSDYPTTVTEVARGPARGHTIQDLIARYGEAFWGDARVHERFPILVKQLRPRFALPLQVHPVKGRDRKNECWYVQTTEPDGWTISRWSGEAGVVAHSMGGTDLFTHLVRDAVFPGMLITIPAGALHALGPEVVVLEVQDTADVTLRVSLWDHKEWNLELNVEGAIEQFLQMQEQAQMLEGTKRQWAQENWQIRVARSSVVRLEPRVPTVVMNGQEPLWQLRGNGETEVVNGLETVLVIPGQSIVMESLAGPCDWLVCEVR